VGECFFWNQLTWVVWTKGCKTVVVVVVSSGIWVSWFPIGPPPPILKENLWELVAVKWLLTL